MYKTLITSAQLEKHISDPDWIIIDCRYDLADRNSGHNAYLDSHIPGAVYADLHDDLSGTPAMNQGRHPLPIPDKQNENFRKLGINNSHQVVVYDASNACFAARLWWMLQYMGHEAVAVLDGGYSHWEQNGLPVKSGNETNKPGDFQGTPRANWLVTVDQVEGTEKLIDSRDPARFRGDIEPLDRVAGHIPGAINHFWQDNVAENGLFREPSELRTEFMKFLGVTNSSNAVFYCGSGVTACHNLLAAAHAGLAIPRLYAGSWSEWCADPARPVATGDA